MTSKLTKITVASARSGFFLFSGGALSGLIMAISAMLIGRFLGSELYGQYSIVMVVPSMIVLLTSFGLNTGLTKFTASLRAEGKYGCIPSIIRHAMLFRLLIATIAGIITVIFSNYLALLINRPDLSFYIQVTSLIVIFQTAFNLNKAVSVGLDKSEHMAISENVQAIIKTILQVGLVFGGFGLIGALIGNIVSFLVAAIVAFLLVYIKILKPLKYGHTSVSQASFMQDLKFLLSYSMPVYIAVVLTGIFPLYQQVVLAFFASNVDIGNFKAAYNFLSLLAILTSAVTTALLPAFSKIETSHKQIIAFFKRVNKYTSLLIVPIATMIILFSQQLIYLIYGSDYTSAALYLSLSVIIYFFVTIGHLSLISVFNGIGKTRFSMRITVVNFIILLLLSPILASIYGVIGVIFASLIAGITASSYSAYIAIRKLNIQFDYKSNLRILIASILASIAPIFLILSTSFNVIIVLSLGVVLYLFIFFTLIPLLKIVTSTELDELKIIAEEIPGLNLISKPLIKYLKIMIALCRLLQRAVCK